ncbi:type II CRISPR RNA-guided endonuclease Cas9 [Alterisphingorhabdus coralli]|uniref:CRISPR-associated endonuclease Cas9 n=1 Tax=Alterisphingorhabdus coralli TaxID=3071408 RepID=A0AA97F7P9_9SPHN|nr:type II CRISPR RNA-guided endonuclease Cas9 [Parasphingorhabdus sp. SCSIO 66989]WOE75909.1 HNH endonuclease domain-containing protein [Parasphingorhabdus sp. SCSIO 66989]
MMPTRLGLDIGTHSIGWCLIGFQPDKPLGDRIIASGVRIFADGRDPKSGAPLAVERRIARAARRRRDRYLGRRDALLNILVQNGLMSPDKDEAKALADFDPYVLRRRALDERLEPYEVGRALFHLNQRRGFRSNRKAERAQDDDGKIHIGAVRLDEAMAKAGARTLGEYLAMRRALGQPVRVRLHDDKDDGSGHALKGYEFYPQRHHIAEEFDAIWSSQARYHPQMRKDSLRDALQRVLLFQRPLKSEMGGACEFVAEEMRLAKAHPTYQQLQLFAAVNRLRVSAPGQSPRRLSIQERDQIIARLKTVKSSSFTALAKLIGLEPGQSFDRAPDSRSKMAGDALHAAMSHSSLFADGWIAFDHDKRWTLIERLLREEDPHKLRQFLQQQYGFDDNQISRIEKAARLLPQGYGRTGPSATAQILTALKRDVIGYDEAVTQLGWERAIDAQGDSRPHLPYYGDILAHHIPPGTHDHADPPEKRWGRINNPTIHISLRQLEKLINQIIAVHGRPDSITVELARELKLSERERDAYRGKLRNKSVTARKQAAILRQNGADDTARNRMLLRLWERLKPGENGARYCPYCGNMITMKMLFNGTAVVDHILPYSRTLDDSSANMTVVHRDCDDEKARRSPWEAWGNSERWERITKQIEQLPAAQQWRFAPDAMDRIEAQGGFVRRQLYDTHHLAEAVRTYLGSLYAKEEKDLAADTHSVAKQVMPPVSVIPGYLTGTLRKAWKLCDLLPGCKETDIGDNSPIESTDHRHHAINAAIVSVTTPAMLYEMVNCAAARQTNDVTQMFDRLPLPWMEFRDHLSATLATMVISHKPDHAGKKRGNARSGSTSGQLHNDTAYGFTGRHSEDGKTPIMVHRIPLTQLRPADLVNSQRIADPMLLEALRDVAGGLDGKAFDAALQELSAKGWCRDEREPLLFKGLKHIRVHEPLKVIPVSDRQGRIYKGFKGNSNARYDVWRLPNGRWVTKWKDRKGEQQSSIISTFNLHQSDYEPPRPHPAAKKMLSLQQNDLLAIERDDGPVEIVRVVKFTANGAITLAHHNEAGPLKARDAKPEGVDPFKYINASAMACKKMRARQVRIDPLGRVFDPGPREEV